MKDHHKKIKPTQPSSLLGKQDILSLFVLGIITVLVTFFRFPDIPQGLSFDEVEFARLAVGLGEKGYYIPYTPYATGHTTLFYYLILASFIVFDISTFALRLVPALSGVLNVFIFYLLLRVLFPARPMLAFAGAFLLATLRWHFSLARFGFEPPFLLMLELCSVLFLFLYKKDKKITWAILSGVFTGLTFNSYAAGRIFFLLPLGAFLAEVIWNKGGKIFSITKQQVIHLLSFVLPMGIIMLPLGLYLVSNPDVRVQQQLFFANPNLGLQEKTAGFGQNIASTLAMFHIQGDENGRHNYPGKAALNIFCGTLFMIGLVRSIGFERKTMDWFFLAWFGISVFPTLLTYPSENPHMLRTFTVVVPIVYWCVSTLAWFGEKLSTYLSPRVLYAIIGCLLLLSALYDIRTYFVYQTQVFPQAFPIHAPLKEAMEMTFDSSMVK